jgi:hypothetical protein
MEVGEHFYADDPRRVPQDGRTNLPGAEYYFLGNGLIQAAVQVCSGKKGTPLGLLLMDPERFGPKSRAFSFDPASGLRSTLLETELGGRVFTAVPGRIGAKWSDLEGIPAVEIKWENRHLSISEVFYCPDREEPRIIRTVTIRNRCKGKVAIILRTGIRDNILLRRSELPGCGERRFHLEYRLSGKPDRRRVEVTWRRTPRVSDTARRFWRRAARFRSSSPLLDHFFAASLFQLPAVSAASGKLDGSIWQYNREWTRDLSMAAIALTLSGRFEQARRALNRALSRFISAAGDTLDSSERRPPEECELDQNGALLFALETYLLWSGDDTLLRQYWPKIKAAAEFPLQKIFRHAPSGLLHNRREFWERHAAHGIKDGLELAHQVWVSMGLSAASRMALLIEKQREAVRWESEARRLKKAVLSDERFALIQDGAFIKRRKATGEVQEEILPRAVSGLPAGMPLFSPGRHLLNPDTSTVLPLAWEFIPPRCRLAEKTLRRIETLWNQRWKGGGYGRYHVTSEPDSPGPWPFPSLFVARAYLEAGLDGRVWRVIRWLGRAKGGRSGSWFEFYGRRPVPPYPQVGIVPWNWVEMLILFIHHLAGIRPEHSSFRLRPRLLSGLAWHRCDLRLRGSRVTVHSRLPRPGEKPGFVVDGRVHPYSEEGLVLPYPRKEMHIIARIPRRAKRKAG